MVTFTTKERKIMYTILYFNTQKRNAVQRFSDLENMHRKKESKGGVAKEISDMVVYCRSKNFNKERIQQSKDGRNHYEMSSFAEAKAEMMMLNEPKFFLWYHQVKIKITC